MSKRMSRPRIHTKKQKIPRNMCFFFFSVKRNSVKKLFSTAELFKLESFAIYKKLLFLVQKSA